MERSSRSTLLVHLPRLERWDEVSPVKNGPSLGGYGAVAMDTALTASLTDLPQQLRQTITWDRGKEMSAHATFTLATGTQVFFADPHAPWQRPTNENTNGLLRQHFPKGTDLSRRSTEDLEGVAHALNNRPRRPSGGRHLPRSSTSNDAPYNNPVLHRPIELAPHTAIRYADRLADVGAVASIGTVEDSYDNAMAESVIGLYKAECVKQDRPFKTIEELELATLMWADWYNTGRLHSSIGYVPPVEYETAYYAETSPRTNRSGENTPSTKSGAVHDGLTPPTPTIMKALGTWDVSPLPDGVAFAERSVRYSSRGPGLGSADTRLDRRPVGHRRARDSAR